MQNIFEFYFKKPDETLMVDWGSLSESAQEYAITYGLRQLLADSFAGAKTQAEASALLAKRWKAFNEGTIGVKLGNVGQSELERIARSVARRFLKSKYKGLSGDVLDEKVEVIWNNPKILSLAEGELAEKRAKAMKAKAESEALAAELGL